MHKVKRQSRYELVAEGIRRLIMDGGLKPDDRLPTEQQLADRFGVSRVAVREATKALSFLGIIQSAPRRGLSVGHVDMQRVTQYLGFHFALAGYPKAQLLQTRLVLEGGALPFVARTMANDPAVARRLVALVDASSPCEDLPSCVRHDIAFHRALLEASGVSPLLAIDDLLQIFFDRFFTHGDVLPPDDPWQRVVDEHRALVDHLQREDVQSAQRVLARHFDPYQGQLDPVMRRADA